jgi:polyprenyldihydroxybenzoate methyltransferase/3-demethylubiquinol 3-O-methyltransferase
MFLLRSTGPAIAAPSRLVRRQPRRNLSWLSGWNTPKAMPPVVVDEALPVAQTAAVPASPSATATSSTTSLEHPTRPTPQQAAPTPPAFSTVNQAEIDHFSRLSSQWWNEKGEFGLLHKMNPTRMEFVRQKIESGRVDDRGWSFETRNEKVQGQEGRWLEGMDVLDVGCGGGLLSEVCSRIWQGMALGYRAELFQSLARVGGNVLGIDASSHNIAIASLHASQDPFLPFHSDFPLTAGKPNAVKTTGSLRYQHTSAEKLREERKQYDVVCSMEVLEHVDSPGEFLKCLADMVKVGLRPIVSHTC